MKGWGGKSTLVCVDASAVVGGLGASHDEDEVVVAVAIGILAGDGIRGVGSRCGEPVDIRPLVLVVALVELSSGVAGSS